MLKIKNILKICAIKLNRAQKATLDKMKQLPTNTNIKIDVDKFKALFSKEVLKNRRIKVTLAAGATAVLITVVSLKLTVFDDHSNMLTTSLVKEANSYEVFLEDDLIGVIKEPNIIDGVVESAITKLNMQHNEVYALPSSLKLVKAYNNKEEFLDDQQFEQNLISTLNNNIDKLLVQAYVVEVENGTTVTLSNLEQVKETLSKVTSKYVPEGESFEVTEVDINKTDGENITLAKMDKNMMYAQSNDPESRTVRTSSGNDEPVLSLEPVEEESTSDKEGQSQEGNEAEVTSVKFVDKVKVNTAFVAQNKVESIDEAVTVLTDFEQEQVIYEVKKGDTLSGIVYDHDMTMEQMEQLNPGIKAREKVLQIGEEIIITKPDPNLSVETTEIISYEQPIGREVKYEEDNTKYSTYSWVKDQGADGVKKITAEVKKTDGVESEKEVLNEVVVSESKPKIIVRGTLTPPQFIPPLSRGTITSYYGSRWGSFHKGLDIAAPYGTNVYASAGGYVEVAGWSGGYGNLVVINHGNGYRTYYGHNSSIKVSVGQYINQGDIIALVGSTGNSTGNHVHFELRQYGSPVNPYSYIY